MNVKVGSTSKCRILIILLQVFSGFHIVSTTCAGFDSSPFCHILGIFIILSSNFGRGHEVQ
jgi:hypothetical protein